MLVVPPPPRDSLPPASAGGRKGLWHPTSELEREPQKNIPGKEGMGGGEFLGGRRNVGAEMGLDEGTLSSGKS